MKNGCRICSSLNVKELYQKNNKSVFICNACGVFFLASVPDIQSLKMFYDSNFRDGVYSNRLREHAVRLRTETFRMWFRILDNYIPQSGTLLDVGCADGIALGIAGERGLEVYGNDISTEASLRAKDLWNGRIYSGITLHELPFEKEFFDCVTMFDFIEHTTNPVEYLQYAGNFLKRGGVLIIATHDAGNWMRWIMGSNWSYLTPDEHFYWFTSKALESILRRSGFNVETIRRVSKYVSMDFLYHEIQNSSRFLHGFLELAKMLLPDVLWRAPLRVRLGELLAVASKAD